MNQANIHAFDYMFDLVYPAKINPGCGRECSRRVSCLYPDGIFGHVLFLI